MNATRSILRSLAACLGATAAVAAAHAGDDVKVWTDLWGDVLTRRTDPELIGAPAAGCTLPNLTKLTVGPWQSSTAFTDPYNGSYTSTASANLLRFDLELKGVVNPPGSVSLTSYNPFQFGPSPLFGFIEFDIDSDRDTGGELGSAAKLRYLANVARFGRLPYGSIGARAAKYGWDLDASFSSPPQYERSGADFVLAFCGCYPTTIVSESGNNNHIFEAGETWIVRGGFFQRAGGYQGACSSTGGASGLAVGMYVPNVNLRWSHDPGTNRTTITLVFASTMTGAGQLAGQSPQPVNLSASDQVSIVEALSDLITGCTNVPVGSPTYTLCQRWAGRNPSDSRFREPDHWSATALVGTAYPEPIQGAVFIWTDTGFDDTHRDLDGNGTADSLDKQVIWTAIDNLDASIWDLSGNAREDGMVVLPSPGVYFALPDVDGNGRIDVSDVRSLCTGDFNRDGAVNIFDYITFFDAYTTGDVAADMNSNGFFDAGDFMVFMNAAAGGC